MNTSGNRTSTTDRQSQSQSKELLYTLLTILGIIVVCVLISMMIDARRAHGQDKPGDKPASVVPTSAVAKPEAKSSSKYQPTMEQAKDLRLAQLEAIQAQLAWNAASQRIPEYAAFNTAVNAIGAVCIRIRTDNKWPADVVCDVNQNPIVFVVEKKPEAAKK